MFIKKKQFEEEDCSVRDLIRRLLILDDPSFFFLLINQINY